MFFRKIGAGQVEAPARKIADRSSVAWLILFLGYVLLPYGNELPPYLLVVFLGVAVWRLLINTRGWYQPGRYTRGLLAILMLAIIVKFQGGVLGRDAGVSLLIGMMALKLLELDTLRDYIVTCLLGFIVILGNFLFSQSLVLAIYLFVGVIIGFTCLNRIAFPGSVSALKRIQTSIGLVTLAIPLMLVMYLLFPRLPGALFALPGSSGGTTGLSDTMSPGSINQLAQSDQPVFYVNFEDSARPMGALYWRAIILWQFDGRTWREGAPAVRANYQVDALDRIYSYEIIQEKPGPWIAALDMPTEKPRGMLLKPGMLFRWHELNKQQRKYSLRSALRYRVHGDSEIERAAGLQLPAVSPKVRALANTWRERSQSGEDIVKAALQYFRQNEFFYTLSPPLLGGDPVEEFLFKQRRGFCEHYASAFAILMRAAGVPARVVNGYLGDNFNPTGDFYTIRQSDAHAWTEVWLAGQGWIRVDPVEAVAPERIEYGIDAIRRLQEQGLEAGRGLDFGLDMMASSGLLDGLLRTLRHQWDAANMGWYRWTAEFDQQKQREFLQSLSVGWSKLLGAGIIMLAMLILTIVLYRSMNRFRSGPVRPETRLYIRFCKQCAKRGVQRRENEGPMDFRNRVVRRLPMNAQGVDQFIQSYIGIHYGDQPIPTAQLRRKLKQVWTKTA